MDVIKDEPQVTLNMSPHSRGSKATRRRLGFSSLLLTDVSTLLERSRTMSEKQSSHRKMSSATSFGLAGVHLSRSRCGSGLVFQPTLVLDSTTIPKWGHGVGEKVPSLFSLIL